MVRMVAVFRRWCETSMMVVIDATLRKNFHKPAQKKFARGIDVSGLHRVSQHLVWRCCSWLPPQRQRTRRERANHFDQPPRSRNPYQWGSATKPVGLQRRCVRERSWPHHTAPQSPMDLGSISLGEGGNAHGSQEEGREEAG